MKKDRKDKSFLNDAWIPEKNATTGFTIKGMALLLILVVIFLTVQYFFR